MNNRLAILALAALLAGCGDRTGRDASDQRTAAGEVMGGTISDAMIPLEQVRSQSPAHKQSAGTAEAGKPGDEAVEAEAEASGAAGQPQQEQPAPPDSGE